ncbi:MAG TPA: patatin-like phospholipase family protein [Candidatus Polarisedimenticolaceae bacterium]|nr:patatin-like phospholipase family protein [Candidatus Polarisedimenticolaceae bacterium]
MRRLAWGLAIALAFATVVEARTMDERRPRIGLALGGGGARGTAHVGALKVLERLKIPIDYVAGTSMGAVIGGLYCSGLPLDEIQTVLEEQDWSAILADRAPYRDLVWRRKEDEGRYLLDLEIGLQHGRLRLPTGLRAGQRLGFELQALLLPVADVADFSRLPVPFRAVATDVETGERVILDHGDLAQSILASMTVPAVFAPVEIDGRLLVDGGMADNLPVEVVRAMGADIVIAIDVGTPLASREAIQSFLGVTGQAFTFLTRLNSERSAALADIVIRPDLAGIASGDFARVPEAIPRGEAAAEAQRAALERLAVDEPAFAAWSAHRVTSAPPPVPLEFVRVEGNQRVDERVILARARVHPGDPLDVGALRVAVRRVFGLDAFQWVRFSVRREGEHTGLVLHVREKPWGPTYLHFGLEAVDDFEGNAAYGVKANLTKTSLNRRGGEWRNDVQIGSHPYFRTELYQPIDFTGKPFVAPWAKFERFRTPIFVDGQKIASYEVRAAQLEVDVGAAYGRFGEVRLGVYRSRVHADVDTGAADLPRFDIDGGGIALQASFDTLDRPSIPHHGTGLFLRAAFSRGALGAADSYDRVEGSAAGFFGFGRHTLFGVADFGTNLGSTIPVYDEFQVGGLFSLGGYSEGELRGQLFTGATVGYHYRLFSLPSGFGEGVYLAVLVEARNVWASTHEIALGDLRYGLTLVAGADTILGPLFLAYGRAEGGHGRFYLTLGRTL